MALWGNNDAVGSTGTVALNYSTGVVTGTATTFGQTGAAQVGDVIRFGVVAGTYFGDAVIVAIGGTTSLTIGSTMGLSGAAIASTDFQISQLPKYTVLDEAYSENPAFGDADAAKEIIVQGNATDFTGIGRSVVGVNVTLGSILRDTLQVGDLLRNDGNDIAIATIGEATIPVESGSGIGSDKIYITEFPGLVAADKLKIGSEVITISSIGATAVSLASTIPAALVTGAAATFEGSFIGLGATVSAGIATDADLEFRRVIGGYDKYVYGVSPAGADVAQNSQFAVSHAGWVGVQTYVDCHGNFRVKGEVLVAQSGITTGNVPVYDAAPQT